MKNQTDKPDVIISAIQDVLKENGNEMLLGEVSDGLEEISRSSRQAREIVVTSPIPLSGERLNAIRAQLKDKALPDSIMVNKINPSLIGGFTVQIGDFIMDASIKNELEELKRALSA